MFKLPWHPAVSLVICRRPNSRDLLGILPTLQPQRDSHRLPYSSWGSFWKPYPFTVSGLPADNYFLLFADLLPQIPPTVCEVELLQRILHSTALRGFYSLMKC